MTQLAPLRSGSVTRKILDRMKAGDSASRIVTFLVDEGMDRQEARDHVAEVIHAEAIAPPGRAADVAQDLLRPLQERLAWQFIMGATLLISGLTVATWHHIAGTAGPVAIAYTVIAAGALVLVIAAWKQRRFRKALSS